MLTVSEVYDVYIQDALENSWTIEQVKMLGAEDDSGAEEKLAEFIEDEGWGESLTLDAWAEYVDAYKKVNPIPIEVESATLGDITIQEDLSLLMDNPDSSWRALKAKFLGSAGLSIDSLRDIESSSRSVLCRLSSDTRDSGTVKGLVFGSVQSGKTANMEALVSMAADTYWNIFVILSGTIESLRIQTRDRFARDLENTQTIAWNHIDLAGDDSKMSASQLKLNAAGDYTYGARYVITCLKNKSRLVKLIGWLYSDKDKARRMRIIVIDDEADQASVNTALILDGEEAEQYEQDRREINRLIVCLANGLLADGAKPDVEMQAINYISYTATPYANVLNEPPGESLYPKDFVHSLAAPKEYFGVNVIFGNPEYVDDQGRCLAPGLNIVRIISKEDVDELKEAHDEGGGTSPRFMESAICWFLCCAAVLRSRGHKKPISMLVHTSGKGKHHSVDYMMVKDFVTKTSSESLLKACSDIYEEETTRFTYADLARDFSSYGLLDTMEKSLPAFESIEEEISELISDVGNIRYADDGAFEYSKGINICIDNCYSDKEATSDVKMRIVYPNAHQLEKMDKAPAFIVVGGNTLARGLTIEGLVCTYFTRNSNQADTLMQMARWFGYRKGCELLQRIWVTEEVWVKFRTLSKVEANLKEEIKRFEERRIRPENLGIKVRAMPEMRKFTLSAKRKMQMADPCDYDFTGYSYEITEFDPDSETLQHNIELSESFLGRISKQSAPIVRGNAVIWEKIGSEEVVEYLTSYAVSEHSSVTNEDLAVFSKWLLGPYSEHVDYWNVAVAGKHNGPSGSWAVEDSMPLPKVERSKKSAIDAWIDIGSLRSGSDALCDVDMGGLSSEQKKAIREGNINKNVGQKRSMIGLGRVPLLLVYRIDSLSIRSTATRSPIGTPCDVMSFSIVVPGDKHAGGNVSAVWIRMD